MHNHNKTSLAKPTCGVTSTIEPADMPVPSWVIAIEPVVVESKLTFEHTPKLGSDSLAQLGSAETGLGSAGLKLRSSDTLEDLIALPYCLWHAAIWANACRLRPRETRSAITT